MRPQWSRAQVDVNIIKVTMHRQYIGIVLLFTCIHTRALVYMYSRKVLIKFKIVHHMRIVLHNIPSSLYTLVDDDVIRF